MEIKNVLFAEALDAWLLCYGGKEEDVEYVGEWNRLARVLCKLALDDEFVEYARERDIVFIVRLRMRACM